MSGEQMAGLKEISFQVFPFNERVDVLSDPSDDTWKIAGTASRST